MEAKIALRHCGIDALDLRCNHEALTRASGNLNINFRISQRIRGSLSDGSAKISLLCALSVEEAARESGEEKERLCDLELEYFGVFTFTIDEDLDIEKEKEDIAALLSVNGTSVLFPYLRSTITSITAATGIEPIVLPTINIRKLLERTESSIEIAD